MCSFMRTNRHAAIGSNSLLKCSILRNLIFLIGRHVLRKPLNVRRCLDFFIWLDSSSRVGISRTNAKSRQRKFVPSSHPGPFALVASSHKSHTKVGTLACFDFL